MNSNKITTKKYKRLPPPQAVPFKGFDFAKIDSREPVAKKLEEFLKKSRETSFFTVGLIRAEWGEGKTDAYERYIKPEVEKKGNLAYLVSTSTIVNKLSKADVLFPISPPESVTLLASIFYSVKDELNARNEDSSLFPEQDEYKAPLLYIQKVLENHLSEKPRKIIYLFLDEFEEILTHSSDIKKKFLSGIKELINGQLKIIHEGGAFEGRLHLIIACTPYAYNQIREDVELAQIFGSFASRISPNLIDLPQINKKEAFQFLMDILRFCYEGKLPDPLPIRSSGILHGVYTISQRNLRALVQLLGDLLNAASSDGELSVIDYEIFLDSLKGKEIGIYGGVTKCIDDDLLIKIEGVLMNIKGYGERCIEVFKMLSGEFQPFSLEEIKQRTNLTDDQAVHNHVEMINQELRKIGIARAIARFEPLKEDKNAEEVIDSLKPVEDEIILSKSRIPLKKFEEETVFFEVDSKGNLFTIMFFPREAEETARIFDIPDDDAEYLQRKLADYFVPTAQKRYFVLSKELADQLYPSPTWMLIEFIVDRSKRMDLWREAVKNIADMNAPLRDGFIEVINSSDKFRIAAASSIFSLDYTLSSGVQVSIPSAIYTTTSRVNLNDVENIKDLMKRERPGLVFLVHLGGIDDDASNELNLMPQVLPMHIKPVRAQQLIVLSLARRRNIDINKNLLEGKLKQFLYELDFGRIFDSWMEKCRNEGILVEDLRKTFGESDRSLAQAMSYCIATIDEETTLQKVFKESSRLRSFTLYGTKEVSFAPLDIETLERFSEYHHDLLSNSFIKQKEAGKIQVIVNPAEKRILEIMGKGKRSIQEIKSSFVIFAQNKAIFEQVYFPILKAKGLIQIGKEEISRVDKEELEESVFKKFKEYNDVLAERKNQPWWSYAHICHGKEREDKIIMLNHFDQFVQTLRQKCEEPNIKYNDGLSMRLLYLLDTLLTHFWDVLEPLVSKAWDKGRTITINASQRKGEIESLLDRLLDDYNRFSDKKYARKDIDDYLNLKTYYDRIDEVGKREYGFEEMQEGLEALRSQFRVRSKYEGVPCYFYYDRPEEQASYFNYKVYQLERSLEAFSTRLGEIKGKCDKIVETRERFTSLGKQIKARLLQYAIDKAYKLSLALHDTLMQCQITPVKAKPLTRLSLDDIKSFFEEVDKALAEFDRRVSTSLTYLEIILSKEKLILSMKDSLSRRANNTAKFFEYHEEMATEANAISVEVARIIDDFSMLSENVPTAAEKTISIDAINEKAKSIDANLATMVSSLNDADKRLLSQCRNSTKILETYQNNIEKFLKVLKEGLIDVTMFGKAFDSTISEAIQSINNLSLGKGVKITWKGIWEDLDQIKRKLFDEVKNVLSEDEFNVLFAVVDASTKQKWFDASELEAQIVSQFGKTEKEAKDLVEALVNKQLLKKGVSLPI